jgi:4-oxalocrotonate tautomerase
MPIVTIQVTREGTKAGVNSVTAEEAPLIKGVSQVLLDVLNKPLDSTYVLVRPNRPTNSRADQNFTMTCRATV